MKNMYFGDVGDFGKYGLLKELMNQELKIGVNWYFTDDESNSGDGKFIDYLKDDKKNRMYKECDLHLYTYLKQCIENKQRNIKKIENYSEFNEIKFYNTKLSINHITGLCEVGRKERIELRKSWFKNSMTELSECDLVFCDPDNGFMPKSMSLTKSKSVKYVVPSEIEDYFAKGMSVMVYNHRDRSKKSEYLNWIYKSLENIDRSNVRILRFTRYSVRDYIFIIHDKHLEKIDEAFNKILNSRWSNFFSPLDFV